MNVDVRFKYLSCRCRNPFQFFFITDVDIRFEYLSCGYRHPFSIFFAAVLVRRCICCFYPFTLIIHHSNMSNGLAKFSEQSVSPKSAALGLTCTNIKVLQSPPAFHPHISNINSHIKLRV